MTKKQRYKAADIKTSILLERSRINREKSVLVFAKSLLLYFTFIFVSVVGFVGGYLGPKALNIMVVGSIGTLIVGVVTYTKTVHNEEKRLTSLLKNCNTKTRK